MNKYHIKIGDQTYQSVFIGNEEIAKIFQGDTLIWEKYLKLMLTLDPNGGQLVDNDPQYELTCGFEFPVVINDPSWIGHTFQEWNSRKDGSGNKLILKGIVPFEDDLTAYAKWIKNYIISFDTQVEGLQVDPIECPKGEKVGQLPIIARQGYKFICWTTEKIGGTIITPDTIPISDLKCYAQWQSLTIKYKKVGSVVVEQDGTAKNFGSRSYLQTIDAINFSKNLSIVIKCKTGSNTSINQETFGMIEPESNLEFGVKDNKFMWEIASGSTAIAGKLNALPSTTYWQKIVKSGNLIECFISNDGISWIKDYYATREINLNGEACIGYDIDNTDEFWRGEIYMNESYVEIDNERFNFELVN